MRLTSPFLLLPLLALALPIPGCALSQAGERGASGKVQVRVWSMWGGDEARVFQNVLDVYNRTHPDVEIVNLSSVTDVKTVRALVAGAPPDFFTIADPAYLGTLAANDAVLPLDDRFQAAGFKSEDFTPGSLSQCRYRGKLYAMPYLVDCVALLYNKKVFREVGLDPEKPPETIEELEEYCRKITTRGPDGRLKRIGLRPPDANTFFRLYGDPLVDTKTDTITADSPRNSEAAAAYKKLMDAQGGNEAVEALSQGFANEQGSYNSFFLGQVGMAFSGQWNTYWVEKYKPDVEYGVAPLPYPAKYPERKGTVWLGGNFFCIPRESKHKKEAWDFMVWMQTDEAQRLLADTLHGVPNRRTALKIRSLREGERWRVMFGKFMDLSDSPNATHFPPLPIASLYNTELTSALDAVRYGRQTPEEALKAVRARVQKEMDRYR